MRPRVQGAPRSPSPARSLASCHGRAIRAFLSAALAWALILPGGRALADPPPASLTGADPGPGASSSKDGAQAPAVKDGAQAPADMVADDTDEEEVIVAPRLVREAASTSVGAEQGRRVAGTQGDALKVVQNLPGVARPSIGSGQIVVWGAAPRETRVYVDGVEIPALYHEGGLRSTLSGDLVKSIELVPGAFGAEFGRALGGLVRVETRDLPPEGVHGFIAADLLDASAMVSASKGRVRAAVAGRQSYLDAWLSGIVSPDIGDVLPIPRYHDAQARVSVALREGESLDASYLMAGDSIVRSAPSADPEEVRRSSLESSFHRVYLRYSRVSPDGSSAVVTPFFGRDDRREGSLFGAVPLSLTAGAWKYGVRAAYRGKVASRATLSAGADVLGALSSLERSGTLTLPPREGDIAVFGQPPGAQVGADAWSAHILDAAPFASARIELGPFTLSPGLRFDAFLLEGSRRTPRVGATPAIGYSRVEPSFSPRLSIAWQPSPRLSMTAAGGLYSQAPEPEDMSAVFGTPALGLSRAIHASLGSAVKLTGALSLETTAYYKSLDRLVVRSRLSTPRLAQALVQDGEGRSFGAQILLRQEMWRGLFGWVSYSIGRSERRYRGDTRWRLFDFDQTHVLAVVAAKELFGFTFGARLRYTTGAPRTPVVGSFYDSLSDRYQPVFGEQNGERLPEFFQLDLRVDRSFAMRPFTLGVSLDVLNVTYQRNAEEVVYSHDYSRRDYITGLPILAVLGARLER